MFTIERNIFIDVVKTILFKRTRVKPIPIKYKNFKKLKFL